MAVVEYPSNMPPKHPTVINVSLGYRPKLHYIKLGDDCLEIWDALIKPGQEVFVYPEDIPEEYKGYFECLDSLELQETAKLENEKYATKEVIYGIEEVKEGGYNIINIATKKPLNEKLLTKKEAEKLRDSVNT